MFDRRMAMSESNSGILIQWFLRFFFFPVFLSLLFVPVFKPMKSIKLFRSEPINFVAPFNRYNKFSDNLLLQITLQIFIGQKRKQKKNL